VYFCSEPIPKAASAKVLKISQFASFVLKCNRFHKHFNIQQQNPAKSGMFENLVCMTLLLSYPAT